MGAEAEAEPFTGQRVQRGAGGHPPLTAPRAHAMPYSTLQTALKRTSASKEDGARGWHRAEIM